MHLKGEQLLKISMMVMFSHETQAIVFKQPSTAAVGKKYPRFAVGCLREKHRRISAARKIGFIWSVFSRTGLELPNASATGLQRK